MITVRSIHSFAGRAFVADIDYCSIQFDMILNMNVDATLKLSTLVIINVQSQSWSHFIEILSFILYGPYNVPCSWQCRCGYSMDSKNIINWHAYSSPEIIYENEPILNTHAISLTIYRLLALDAIRSDIELPVISFQC